MVGLIFLQNHNGYNVLSELQVSESVPIELQMLLLVFAVRLQPQSH